MNVISIGEVLWDVLGDTEHLGGAPLNFAAHLARLGHTSYMVSGVADDNRGRRAISGISALGLSTDYILQNAQSPTGHVSVTLAKDGQPQFTIHRPAAYDFAQLESHQLKQLASLNPEWVYFGTLAQTSDIVRNTTRSLLCNAPKAKRFYDVNFRVGCYDKETVVELLQLADVVKLNDAELPLLEDFAGLGSRETLPAFCTDLKERYDLLAICVTRGSEGCALLLRNEYVESPGYAVKVEDAIGAGDAFAAGLVHGIGSGWEIQRAADFANRLGALVASRPGAIPEWSLQELDRLPARV